MHFTRLLSVSPQLRCELQAGRAARSLFPPCWMPSARPSAGSWETLKKCVSKEQKSEGGKEGKRGGILFLPCLPCLLPPAFSFPLPSHLQNILHPATPLPALLSAKPSFLLHHLLKHFPGLPTQVEPPHTHSSTPTRQAQQINQIFGALSFMNWSHYRLLICVWHFFQFMTEPQASQHHSLNIRMGPHLLSWYLKLPAHRRHAILFIGWMKYTSALWSRHWFTHYS